MRIRRLSLDFFGQFTERSFDFGKAGRPSDFHVIHGSNEAGKTTTMEGYLRLLFGFPSQDPYDFLHQRKNLMVSGELEFDGKSQNFSRLPKRAGNLLDETGNVLPEQAISGQLGGLSKEDYRNLLCLDDETIEKGGEDIANARGDIGHLLFSAAAGVADLSAMLEQTRNEAQELYRKRASTTRMAGLKRELSEIETRIREIDVTAGEWENLKLALRNAEEEESSARRERDRLRTEQARNAAFSRALPDLGDHDRLAEQIANYADWPVKLELDPEELFDLAKDQSKAESERTRLNEAINSDTSKRDDIEPNGDCLGLAEELDDLDDSRSRAKTADLDLDRRKGELREIEAVMARIARDLGASDKLDPVKLVVPLADLEALERTRNNLLKADRDRDAEAREVDNLRDSVKNDNDLLETLMANAPSLTGIRDLLDRFDADAFATSHARARAELDVAEHALADSVFTLSVGGRHFESVPDCPIDISRAEELAEEHAELAERIAHDEAALRNHRENEDAINARKASLLGSAGLTDEAEQARSERDNLWRKHREALTAKTASAFEPAMKRVDDIVDSQLTHASDLGEIRKLEQDLAESRARAKNLDSCLLASREKAKRIENTVQEMTQKLDLPALSPAGFRDWVRRCNDSVACQRKRDGLSKQHRPTLEKAEKLRDALLPFLSLEDPDFEEALAAAKPLSEKERECLNKIESAKENLKNRENDLKRRLRNLDILERAASDASNEWTTLVRKQFSGNLDPEIVAAVPSALREMREKDTARSEFAHRIETMEKDRQKFADKIRELANQHGIEPGDPHDSFQSLREIVEAAQKDRNRRESLEARIAESAENLDVTENRLSDIERQILDYGMLFPKSVKTDTLDDLRSAAQKSREIIDTRNKISELENRILNGLSVQDLDAARALLHGLVTHELEAQANAIASDLELAETRLSNAAAARGAAERDLSTIAGDAEVAKLVERRTTLELEIERTALDYLETVFGLRLADEAIRRYRDEHRSGMMKATERAFAELTNGAYQRLRPHPDGKSEVLLAVDTDGNSLQAGDMSKGTRFQLYLALRAAAYEQLADRGIVLPFFCDDVFETFDDERTRAACRLMARIGRRGQAIYLTHHRHVVDIASEVCEDQPTIHDL